MSIFDSPPADRHNFRKKKDDQQFTNLEDYYKNFHLVKDNVSPWVLVFMCLFLMSLALYALFDHEYKLYNVNVNNKTVDSFICQNTSVLLI